MITAADIVAEARTWERVPYRHQRRSRRNVDCAGLIIVVAWAAGVWPRTFDVQGYPREPDGSLPARLIAAGLVLTGEYAAAAQPATVEPGAVLMMGPPHNKASHLAISLGRDIIHASLPFGRVIRHRLAPPYTPCVQATYRYPGVTYG